MTGEDRETTCVGSVPPARFVELFEPTAEPVLWTTKGNIPLSLTQGPNPRLKLDCEWEIVPGEYVKAMPFWTLDGEVVKQEANILSLKPLTAEAAAGKLV